MDTSLKRILHTKMDEIAPEYGLLELSYPSFVRSYGYKSQPLCAADVVDGVSALLEAAGGLRLEVEVEGGRNGGEWFGGGREWKMRREDNKPNGNSEGEEDDDEWWKNNFWVAFDALSSNSDLLHSSLQLSMSLQRSIIRQGSSLIEKGEIKRMRTFQFAMLKEGPDLSIFAHPGNLSRLALWLVEATRDKVDPIVVGRSKKRALPMVLAALDERRGTYLVVGVVGAPEMGDIRKK